MSKQESVVDSSNSQQQGFYREALNRYFQKGETSEPHSFEDLPSPDGIFKCSVRVIMKDSTVIRGMSSNSLSFRVKASAREDAAKDAVIKIQDHLLKKNQSAPAQQSQQGKGMCL